ncbi:MAG: hypothetical protein ACP5E4_00690 [Candidatus Aenigmatarchaeota archaeon]
MGEVDYSTIERKVPPVLSIPVREGYSRKGAGGEMFLLDRRSVTESGGIVTATYGSRDFRDMLNKLDAECRERLLSRCLEEDARRKGAHGRATV